MRELAWFFAAFVLSATVFRIDAQEPRLLWAKVLTPSYEQSRQFAIAEDKERNIYVGSGFTIGLSKYRSDGELIWGIGPTNASYTDNASMQVTGITINDAGLLTISGRANGDVRIGDSEILRHTFIATITPDRSLINTKSATGSSDTFSGHASDSQGNHVIGFHFILNEFGYEGIRLTPTVGRDMGVLKVDAQGTPIWWRRGSGTGSEWVNSVLLGGNGEVFVLGTFSNSQNFGLGGAIALGDTGSINLYLVKLDRDGTAKWAKSIQTGADSVYGQGTGTGHHSEFGDSLIWAGYFSGSQELDSHRFSSAGGMDIFVTKISDDGSVNWVRTFGGSGDQFTTSVVTDSHENIYIAGIFNDRITLGPWTLESRGLEDIFVAKLQPDGTPAWLKHLGYTGTEAAATLAISKSGELLVAGAFSGGLLIDGTFIEGSSALDGFIAKFESESTPPEFSAKLESQTASAGTTVTFEAEATSPTPVSYQWWFNGVPLDGETNAVLTISSVEASDAGSYYVVAQNQSGSVESNAAILTYTDASTLELSIHPTLTIYGTLGKVYRIDYATETKTPATWNTITNLVLSTTPQIWVDVEAAVRDQRYYRVVLVLEP